MPSDERLDRLAVLESMEEIRNLARKYAHFVWQGDVPSAIDMFTEDGEMNTGERPPIVGKEKLLQVYGEMLGQAMLHPFVHNHVIDLAEDGESATGVCYLDLRATTAAGSVMGSGFYNDRYQRVDGVWKFRSRQLNMEYLVKPGAPWIEDQG